MNVQAVYPVDPMAVFFAAVTSVENGKVGEVELEFRHVTQNGGELIMSMIVRREPRSIAVFTQQGTPEEDNETEA